MSGSISISGGAAIVVTPMADGLHIEINTVASENCDPRIMDLVAATSRAMSDAMAILSQVEEGST